MPKLPTDIEHAIRDLITHAQDAGRTGSPTAHSLTAVARVSLETVIDQHMQAYREMKAALEAQTSGI